MKSVFIALFASVIALSTLSASAQVLGVVGWAQGGSATSGSAVNGSGGSGAAFIGVSGTQTTAGSSNLSGALVTQVPGSTSVITESVSAGGMQSTSGALGLAAAGSGSAFSAGG